MKRLGLGLTIFAIAFAPRSTAVTTNVHGLLNIAVGICVADCEERGGFPKWDFKTDGVQMTLTCRCETLNVGTYPVPMARHWGAPSKAVIMRD